MKPAADPPAPPERQRIDKWLWHARMARTRTAAQHLAVSGRIRVNREKTDTSSRAVKIGDVLTMGLEGSVRVLRIVAFAARRGPAAEARLLYEDLSPAPVPGSDPPRPAAERTGRPSKRDRRRLAAFKGTPSGDDDLR